MRNLLYSHMKTERFFLFLLGSFIDKEWLEEKDIWSQKSLGILFLHECSRPDYRKPKISDNVKIMFHQ